MKIELHEISIRDIVDQYADNEEEGVVGYHGLLNIRPKYQREFIYKPEQRNAVIDTIMKKFPLNVMYWVKNADNTFELLDGQQRTISFCQYVVGNFSVDNKYFHSLTNDEKDKILDYKVLVYFCEGTDKEKLDWFRTINIAGEKLTNQELRNATYTGPWLTHAKSIFSKTNCSAYLLSKDYVKSVPIRQELLEIALNWKSNGKIEEYMSLHQHDQNANELFNYFKNVIMWIEQTFIKTRSEMKKVTNWNELYLRFNNTFLDTAKLENEICKLMQDDEVQKKSAIYEYVLTRDSHVLNLRTFSDNQKRKAYEKQKGICPICKRHYELEEMEGDHIIPWIQGGKTIDENCHMLCKHCNRTKSDT